jgi:hypothetical protein
MRFISHVAICLTAQVVLAVSAGDAAGGRPSEADVRACVANTEQGRVYGAVLRFEFGKTFTSQGGTIEMAMGAPQGTPIFPTKLYFPAGWVGVAWIFQDPFGAWECKRNGDMKKGADPEYEAALNAKPRDAGSKTMAMIRAAASAFEAYQSDFKRLPPADNIAELSKLLSMYFPADKPFKALTLDAWGNPLRFLVDPNGTNYRIVSGGSDGRIDASSLVLRGRAAGETAVSGADIIFENGAWLQYPKGSKG